MVEAEETRLPAVARYPGRFFTEEHLSLVDGPVVREGKARLTRGFYGNGHAPCPPAPAQMDMTNAGNMYRGRCLHPVIQRYGVLSGQPVLIYHVVFLSFKKLSPILFIVCRQRLGIATSIPKRGDVPLFHLKFLDNCPGGRMILLMIQRKN